MTESLLKLVADFFFFMHLHIQKLKHYLNMIDHFISWLDQEKQPKSSCPLCSYVPSVKVLMQHFLVFVDRNEAEKGRTVRRC